MKKPYLQYETEGPGSKVLFRHQDPAGYIAPFDQTPVQLGSQTVDGVPVHFRMQIGFGFFCKPGKDIRISRELDGIDFSISHLPQMLFL